MIYAVVNTKGGVGKTTTAVHLATMLAIAGAELSSLRARRLSARDW
jgi:chromosome partitioning protein